MAATTCCEKFSNISGVGCCMDEAHFKEKHFDIIICRNVFIYFSREKQEQLFQDFYDALNIGGYLVLGNTETMSQKFSKKFETIDMKSRVYRKV